MEYTHKKITAEQYNSLRERSGMGHPKKSEQIERAMEGSLFLVSVFDGDEVIGLGRIVGDGGITYGLTDIMVDKRYQGQGIGNRIMDLIDEWLNKNTDKECFIMLLARIPADKLYLRHGFVHTEPEMVGMLRKQDK